MSQDIHPAPQMYRQQVVDDVDAHMRVVLDGMGTGDYVVNPDHHDDKLESPLGGCLIDITDDDVIDHDNEDHEVNGTCVIPDLLVQIVDQLHDCLFQSARGLALRLRQE